VSKYELERHLERLEGRMPSAPDEPISKVARAWWETSAGAYVEAVEAAARGDRRPLEALGREWDGLGMEALAFDDVAAFLDFDQLLRVEAALTVIAESEET
jgi:hypothetical protein